MCLIHNSLTSFCNQWVYLVLASTPRWPGAEANLVCAHSDTAIWLTMLGDRSSLAGHLLHLHRRLKMQIILRLIAVLTHSQKTVQNKSNHQNNILFKYIHYLFRTTIIKIFALLKKTSRLYFIADKIPLAHTQREFPHLLWLPTG